MQDTEEGEGQEVLWMQGTEEGAGQEVQWMQGVKEGAGPGRAGQGKTGQDRETQWMQANHLDPFKMLLSQYIFLKIGK
jgi:hypothetical protein